MNEESGVRSAEDWFFQALLRGDAVGLERVLTPDFLLIDVMTGTEIPGALLVELVGSRQLVFESVERIDSRVRLYGEAAIVTGQTRMRGRYGNQTFGGPQPLYPYIRARDGCLAAGVGSRNADCGCE
jgi:hypothetical protein